MLDVECSMLPSDLHLPQMPNYHLPIANYKFLLLLDLRLPTVQPSPSYSKLCQVSRTMIFSCFLLPFPLFLRRHSHSKKICRKAVMADNSRQSETAASRITHPLQPRRYPLRF